MAFSAKLTVEGERQGSVFLNGLGVGHHRLADIGRNLELAFETVDKNLKVKFAHAGKNRLPRLLILAELACRILCGKSLH